MVVMTVRFISIPLIKLVFSQKIALQYFGYCFEEMQNLSDNII